MKGTFRRPRFLINAFSILMFLAACTIGQVPEPEATPSVPYVPTPQPVVDAMLKLAGVTKKDIVYDLGSGDGRIPITAAKEYGARAYGVELDPERVKEANENAKAAGVTSRVKFIQGDLFKQNYSEATVVTLYLLSSVNAQLRPKLLEELKPGTRIVSHAFRMGDWEPEQTLTVHGSVIYLWTVPPRKTSSP